MSAAEAADVMPKFNIPANCRAELNGASAIGETLASCIGDEQAARDQLSRQWAQYARDEKAVCISETSVDGTPSYVELLTCLELSSEAKARRKSAK
ncbi:hypothetical protein [Bradyrhizobium sp. STM 3809]|uniref:hypothetical protein n=1 Tax=Bradyrhizobium sp. STM 3809 TaxID=551936 RepID=UPI0005546E64|nr:hypothetical protein [Bradyrhizobium sp. STM 3809]